MTFTANGFNFGLFTTNGKQNVKNQFYLFENVEN